MKYLIVVVAILCGTAWAQPPVAMHAEAHARPRVPKFKPLRSNPHRFTAIRFQGTDPYDAPDDDYLCSSTVRRPKVVRPQSDVDQDLSPYVQVRLAVARARALQKYREAQA